MWRIWVLETPFGLLLRFIYDSTSRHYNYSYSVRSSLPCWFFILVGPLIAGFLVAALISLLWSALTLRLWSVPLICSDVASLIGSFDLLWRCVSDRLLWSPLTLRLCSAPLICCPDRLLWSLTLRLWSAPLIFSDVASLIGSFDLLLLRCVSDRLLWSPLTLRLWSAPLICCSDVASLIGFFDLLWRCVSDRLLWSFLTLRLWSAPLICCSDVASLIGSFYLLWSTRFLFLNALK
jgi:hypothetical protein